MASLPPQDEYRTLVKRINSSNYLLNKQLQHICSVNGLRSGGVKAELQRRLIDGMLGYSKVFAICCQCSCKTMHGCATLAAPSTCLLPSPVPYYLPIS